MNNHSREDAQANEKNLKIISHKRNAQLFTKDTEFEITLLFEDKTAVENIYPNTGAIP